MITLFTKLRHSLQISNSFLNSHLNIKELHILKYSPPRLVLINTALGFIDANAAGPNIPFVSSVKAQLMITTSLSLSNWSKETKSADTSAAANQQNQ